MFEQDRRNLNSVGTTRFDERVRAGVVARFHEEQAAHDRRLTIRRSGRECTVVVRAANEHLLTSVSAPVCRCELQCALAIARVHVGAGCEENERDVFEALLTSAPASINKRRDVAMTFRDREIQCWPIQILSLPFFTNLRARVRSKRHLPLTLS